MWGASLTRPLLFYLGSFSYTPCAVLCGVFLLHVSCCFIWGVSLTRPFLFFAGSYSYTSLVLLWMEVFLQAPHLCDQKVDKPMQEQGVFREVCVPCLRSSNCQALDFVSCLLCSFLSFSFLDSVLIVSL